MAGELVKNVLLFGSSVFYARDFSLNPLALWSV